jgi:PqqD family protein of HPr-rel-A system
LGGPCNGQHGRRGGLGQSIDRGERRYDQEAQEAVNAARWRAATGLLWTRYDDSDEWLVYNPASADIHLLSDAAHRLWALTSGEAPLTADELIVALFDDSESPPAKDFVTATQESLAFMDRAGLVRAEPSE